MQTIIQLNRVGKTFHGKNEPPLVALKDITLEIRAGEFLIILGPSGSGKSTLLRIMSGLEHDYAGAVKYGPGISHADFSFVFQQFALLPWLSVAENVGLGLVGRGVGAGERLKKVTSELKLFGLEKFAGERPRVLSGGMRQRVGIARALATDPKVIFLDEPFSELDSFTAGELRDELLKIWQERSPTIVMVTHIIEEALLLADRVAVLTARPGRIETVLTNTLTRPRALRSAPFYALADQIAERVKP